MKDIVSPSEGIKKLLQTGDNSENLQIWIDLIIGPFKNYPKANWFEIHSVLNNEDTLAEEIFSNHPESFARLDFPITVAGLYGLEKDTSASACLSLDTNLNAEMVTELERHDVFNSKDGLVSSIKGTWEEVVEVYLKFLNKLTTIPIPIPEMPLNKKLSLADQEHELIKSALEKYKGKRRDAAKELGISERTLYRKMQEYKLFD